MDTKKEKSFSPGGIMVENMLSIEKSIVQVGKWIFVHGGLTPPNRITIFIR